MQVGTLTRDTNLQHGDRYAVRFIPAVRSSPENSGKKLLIVVFVIFDISHAGKLSDLNVQKSSRIFIMFNICF